MLNKTLLNAGMDIDDIRRANICKLEKLAGSPTAAALLVDMSYSQYLNYRNGAKEAKTGKLRGMRKETAWRFEDAFKKPRGWLDTNHDTAAHHEVAEEPAPYRVSPKPARKLVQDLCDLAAQISDDGLHELVGFARCLTGTHPLVRQKKARVISMDEWRRRSVQSAFNYE